MSRMIAKTIATALDAAAVQRPSHLAVVSPFQSSTKSTTGNSITASSTFTYEDLRRKTNELAGFLQAYGYERNDIMVSDLPNIAENLILQIACNRLGVTYATTKNLEGMAKLPKVRGSVCATGEGYLADTNLSLPYLSGEFLMKMVHGDGLDEFGQESYDQEDGDSLAPHAYYNNTVPFSNEEALKLGEDAAWELAMVEQDVVCISVTLCHAFGMGSAVCAALQSGATMVLPSVGGIQGCGVPSERAKATFDALEQEKCTLLFADTHTLEALAEYDKPERLSLRGGVCKTGSGSDFLSETVKYGGVSLKTMGKKQ
ncbi:AMP-binding enzyme [Nitzschia inconspicua]|uniref:AMP-binding enzyme n=1 Tax=Nitzschia inconspicua TaxID=303405 RepID=A0A9K3LDG2_9STRA|nr:AMP-binding enzyme [Nitzschia inconspicua]